MTTEDDGYSALHEAEHILIGIQLENQSMAFRLRQYMAALFGRAWYRAAVTEHTMPGGSVAWTASLFCLQCQTVHVYIAELDERGEIRLANPVGE